MSENIASSRCARCGAALSPGTLQTICPRCLMALNLGPQTEVPGEEGPGGTRVNRPPPPVPSPEIIAKLFPQLEILGSLGSGGMGAVYKARQLKLDRIVALKILLRRKADGTADPGFAERFAREARALARLNHPNIVAVYEYGEAGDFPYLIMEYVDGVTLRQLLHGGKILPEQALAIVPKICEALQFAHEQGVVHRDIKPENILLDQQGRVKIADFGIAKILAPGAQNLSLTGGQDVVGTPNYMAPEQVEQPARVDHRADIFSLGVVFYEMLTGELPLGRFPPPSSKLVGVQVDVRLDEVVLHALEKQPERRYQHASEVKSAVENIASTPPPAGSQPLPAIQPLTAEKRRKGEFIGLGAAIQAIGLACFLIPKVGFLIGLGLLLIGGRLALKLLCSRCGNSTTRHAKICNSCGAHFVSPATGSKADRFAFARIPLIQKREHQVVTHWPGVLLTGGLMLLVMAGGLLLAAAIGMPDKPVHEVFLMLVLPALLMVPVWLFLEVRNARKQADHPATTSLSLRTAAWSALWCIVVVIAAWLGVLYVLKLGPWSESDGRLVTISGTVKDAFTGQPISGARVDDNRYGAAPDRTPRQTWTRTNGVYELVTYNEEHTLAASASEYKPATALFIPGKSPAGISEVNFSLEPVAAAENSPALTDWNRAIALFNQIEDFGHEFDAAFQARNLSAAKTGTDRLLNLIKNFNITVHGTGYELPDAILAEVREALDFGDWEKVRAATAHNGEYARAFRNTGSRLTAIARDGTNSVAVPPR